MIIKNKEFQFFPLSGDGIDKCLKISMSFDEILTMLNEILPEGPEKAIVRTRLQEACMFARRAVSLSEDNQSTGGI